MDMKNRKGIYRAYRKNSKIIEVSTFLAVITLSVDRLNSSNKRQRFTEQVKKIKLHAVCKRLILDT